MSDQANQGAEQVAADAAPVRGTQEYVQAMAAKYENQGGEAEAQQAPTKPDGGHDKFWNAETGVYNWDAHNKEVEWQKQQAADKDVDDYVKEPPKADEVNIENSFKAFNDAVVKGDKETAGKVAQQLKAAGVPEQTLKAHVGAIQTLREQKRQEVIDYAGGQDAAVQMKAWAEKNLSADERAAYQDALGGPAWKMALDSLKSRMGTTPSIHVDGGGGSGVDGGAFADQQQLADAMKDPRYKRDAAYRAEVRRRAALS